MHAFNIDSQVSNLDSQSQVCLLFWILIYYYWLRLLSINIRYSKQCMWLQLRAPWLMLFVFCTAFSLRSESVRGAGGDFKPLILMKFLIEAHWRLNIITGPFAGEYFFFQIWIYTCLHFTVWPFLQVWGHITLSGFSIKKLYYIAESASRQDEVNFIFWLTSHAGTLHMWDFLSWSFKKKFTIWP